ncbi:hypothetical protein N658DRAFT_55579 [Parathielavia hyrcaniae]|uniref:Uncharacterized protein n=1 Tax=Parathielavia hyrcaniae TaxID=113614 RepID=A0AAN6PU59_9PEZI|nr:hypothetical protein N658DRAFT_55579 [Parathielavia hyrcaniae]
MFNVLSLHPETAAFPIGCGAPSDSRPRRRAPRINRAPPLRRPFLVLSTFSLSHIAFARSLPSHFLCPPPWPFILQLASVAHALIPVSPSWMPCPFPLWRPRAACRRPPRAAMMGFAVHSPEPSAEMF